MSETQASIVPWWLCRLTGKHLGHVGFSDMTGPYWICSTCGAVVIR